MTLTLQDFVMLAKFIQDRWDPGGSVKIFDQIPHQADYVIIDWPISAQLLAEFNLLQGDGFTSKKPTKPGGYWTREPGTEPSFISVIDVKKQEYWHEDGYEASYADWICEWAGPLEPPA